MKNIILIVASVILLTKPMWPIVEYIVNYDYIVNVLCENKDKPELECNGKCHLSSELAKETEKGKENPINGKTSKTEIPQIIISFDLAAFTFSSTSEFIATQNIGYRPSLNTSLFVSEILHPPQIL